MTRWRVRSVSEPHRPTYWVVEKRTLFKWKNAACFLTDRVETIRMPEPSDYEAVVAGVHYRPRKGQEPNAFHRWMQGWAFGVRWRRVT